MTLVWMGWTASAIRQPPSAPRPPNRREKSTSYPPAEWFGQEKLHMHIANIANATLLPLRVDETEHVGLLPTFVASEDVLVESEGRTHH